MVTFYCDESCEEEDIVTSETVTVTACIEIPLLPHISMKYTFKIILLLSSVLDNRLGVILLFP